MAKTDDSRPLPFRAAFVTSPMTSPMTSHCAGRAAVFPGQRNRRPGPPGPNAHRERLVPVMEGQTVRGSSLSPGPVPCQQDVGAVGGRRRPAGRSSRRWTSGSPRLQAESVALEFFPDLLRRPGIRILLEEKGGRGPDSCGDLLVGTIAVVVSPASRDKFLAGRPDLRGDLGRPELLLERLVLVQLADPGGGVLADLVSLPVLGDDLVRLQRQVGIIPLQFLCLPEPALAVPLDPLDEVLRLLPGVLFF